MILLISGCIGVSVVLLILQFAHLYTSLPEEDRAWRDKPLLAFRLVWPFIQLFDHYGSRFYSEKRHNAALSLLRQAGLEFTLSSGQLIASRMVGALAMCVLCACFLWVMDFSLKFMVVFAALWGYWYPDLWVKRVIKTRQIKMDRDLPFYLDVVTLAVESGTNLTGALTQAVQKAPDSPLRIEFSRVLRDIRAGKPRTEALRELSERAGNPALTSVVSGMNQAERSGASLGPVMRAQATQLRNARFASAEKKAMEAPVRLLAPLMTFIFPTTFVVLGFLILSKLIQQNIVTWAPIAWAYSWPG